MLHTKISLHIFTYSKHLFDSITNGNQATEKRLIIGISAAQMANRSCKINHVVLMSSSRNFADGSTKLDHNDLFLTLIKKFIDTCPVDP